MSVHIADNDHAAILSFVELYPALVNDCDPRTGETPLHHATKLGKLGILKCLLAGKRSPFVILDKAGKSIFDIAIDENVQDVVELLLGDCVLKVQLEQREPVTRIFYKLVKTNPDLVERFLNSLGVTGVPTTEVR